MQDNEFYTTGGSAKELYGKCWVPEKTAQAVIAILPGLGDHINRYHDFAGFFAGHRMAVIGIDLHGHGRSGGKRGHMGRNGMILTDVQQLMLETRRRFTEIPIFLYGHCMGGNFAMNFLLRQSSREISGAILSSPFIFPDGSSVDRNFLKIPLTGRLFPSLTLSFNLDPMELTRDPAAGREYFEDPVKHDRISVRLYNQLKSSSGWIIKNTGKLVYPLLVMHGKDDRITSWKNSRRLEGEIPGNLAEFKYWDGMRHELHHELSKKQVYEYILSWICRQLQRTES